MRDKIFLDSNVLIYSYSNSELTKQSIARKIITESHTFISTQVLQELTNTITKKLKFSFRQAESAIEECTNNSNVHANNVETILHACRIAEKYLFSFYDSLIVSAAMECGCTILYLEDMQHGQKIEQTLTILNPFL